jgi:hypothetical protein
MARSSFVHRRTLAFVAAVLSLISYYNACRRKPEALKAKVFKASGFAQVQGFALFTRTLHSAVAFPKGQWRGCAASMPGSLKNGCKQIF